ncbi:hypothetical protein IP510_05805 [Psychrobacter sp. NG254]|uniref:hypothetical protein n=1 Tax=Psychrobacter sp. NG254 TaxID=2782003 RepID=UPI001887CB93|nr:hypothetical protein [Psychrobacter sp. NG254]MBF2719393.1 hypothetical protein [Psychrobacter sp. NG254]
MYLSHHNLLRQDTTHLLRQSISHKDWLGNSKEVESIKNKIEQHQLFNHSIIEKLNQGELSLPHVQFIHLEYQHSIVEIFTDALLMAQFQAKQLDEKIVSSIKMQSRFLLSLNIIDEFGLSQGKQGNITSLNAHFCLYKKVLVDLGISPQDELNHQYTDESQNLRNYLESAYESYPMLILLLAVAEQQVIAFSSALKNAVEHLGVDIKDGYYYVHGTTEEDTKSASDDLHENDLWLLLTHSLHLSSVPDLKQAALDYCNYWDSFWSKMSNIENDNTRI